MTIRVLVVDDAISSREAIRAILEGAGMQVVAEAASGLEALERYKALHPDLVTMDLVMPQMSGTEAAALIRQHDGRARIIAVSGLTQPSVMAEAQDVGIAAFVAKPLDAEELLSEIDQLMNAEE